MSGLYFDPHLRRLFDSHGNYLRNAGQLDSLMLFVTLKNNSWPCNVPTILTSINNRGVMIPLMGNPADWPCYLPDITDLSTRILFATDKGRTIRPKYVWGRRNNVLSLEETLVVMFLLRDGKDHILTGAQTVYLELTGFDAKISLPFSLKELLPSTTIDTTQPTAAR
jgi:hypothetical protein